jgi:hypothetical protein
MENIRQDEDRWLTSTKKLCASVSENGTSNLKYEFDNFSLTVEHKLQGAE